jgi:hypothetical protein
MSKNILHNATATNVTLAATDCGFVDVTGVIALDTFIVPNGAVTIPDFFSDSDRAKIINIVVNNKVDYNVLTDKVIEFWHVSEHDDDVTSHYLTFNTNDGREVVMQHPGIKYIPAKLFVGKHEGENHKKAKLKMEVIFSMCLRQYDYRYRRFGTFEQCFNKLVPELSIDNDESVETVVA